MKANPSILNNPEVEKQIRELSKVPIGFYSYYLIPKAPETLFEKVDAWLFGNNPKCVGEIQVCSEENGFKKFFFTNSGETHVRGEGPYGKAWSVTIDTVRNEIVSCQEQAISMWIVYHRGWSSFYSDAGSCRTAKELLKKTHIGLEYMLENL